MAISTKIISFEYISLDEQLLTSPRILQLDPAEASSMGEQEIPMFNSARRGFNMMHGFFISYRGHEYGSITMTEAQFYELLTSKRCKPRRIHVRQFAKQFR